MISCQILGFSDTFKVLLFFSVEVTKILLSISLAANLQENSITPNKMIIYLAVWNNTQGNRYFPWQLGITLKVGGSQKPPRKPPYSVYLNLQGNCPFLGGLIFAPKKILDRQGNSSFLQCFFSFTLFLIMSFINQ